MLNEIITVDLRAWGLSEEEYSRRNNKRAMLQRALRECSTGDVQNKAYVKEFIADLLLKTYQVNSENLNHAIAFDKPASLSAQEKFAILLHMFKKEHGNQALECLIEKYELDKPKYIIEDGQTESYVITAEEINEIFNTEYHPLVFEDRLAIVVQIIYQNYKGFSVIDEIRDQNIDGVSGGVSGIPSNYMYQVAGEYDIYFHQMKKVPETHDSIWLFYRGKSIHLSFLSFGSEHELKRVCQNIYKYNHPGQLSETTGYKVNEMKDGSRIVVLRPPFAESWSFFVRKFDIPNATLLQLITDKNAGPVIRLIKYLVKGCRVTAVTGAQGTGKTTLLMAMVKHISAIFPLRVQEMAFELHLRQIYPYRNILTLRETDNISGQEGLDIQKKTDGAVNIVGEVATDPVAAWVIQTSQVASLFTLFSHHAKTFISLIESLRNSMLKTGVFSNEKIAEEQVIRVINFDIHLNRSNDGHRYIERITECVPAEQKPYDRRYNAIQDKDSREQAFMDTMVDFMERMTDRKLYEARNIVEYRDGEYVFMNKISDANLKAMLASMNQQDSQEFQLFIGQVWGGHSHG
ncbi:pilus assembly protein CpaF [Paenibacillus thiaminolyticus]|uniref:Pilus assembly protein CpaF n=2 Tax=Paenibacillus thiaminolyticus TaxID=49283 RepID=A0A3A3GD31_PANTH|nr:pilus assembly protein CpaF [Paenibacillus thiaminolyticus]